MTHGTSAHGEGLAGSWADTGQERSDEACRRWTTGLGLRIEGVAASGEAVPLQLLTCGAVAGLALGLTITEAWHSVNGGLGGTTALPLAILAAACTVAALVALWPSERAAPPPAPRREQPAAEGPSQLLAQLHHDLRTPLNAMIGFSEVMLRELHGPLGNARYQEYAAHISESGGRLLKASEDALAVATTMSALVADRRAVRRERLPAAALLQEAWAASTLPAYDVRLSLQDCAAVEIECDGRATSQALQQLLGEALVHTRPGGAIAATGRRSVGAHHIEIAVEPCGRAHDGRQEVRHGEEGLAAAGAGLRVILARSLLEMQGATLGLSGAPHTEEWSARITFPAGRHPRPGPGGTTSGSPRRACQGRREGFAGVSAARASAGSHAAPPA
jgi:signal transduction histidine kinase